MGRVWNDSETMRKNLHSRKLTRETTLKTKQKLVSRLNDDLDYFFDHGGKIEVCPPCQCAIDAVTNKHR